MRYLITTLLIIIVFVSCTKNRDYYNDQNTNGDIDLMQSFDFKSSEEYMIEMVTKNINNQPLSNVYIEIYKSTSINGQFTSEELFIPDTENLIFKGSTNNQGRLIAFINIPTMYDEVVIHTKYAGLPLNSVIELNSNDLFIDLMTRTRPTATNLKSVSNSNLNGFYTLGTWNSLGVPNYLEPVGDNITSSFLADINASLPESLPLPVSHPQYLAENVEVNINVIQTAEIWVTFVHEGAGWKNVLGYYTYPTNSPPSNLSDITNKTFIFPNNSYSGSGGGLLSGDKVQLKYYNETLQYFQDTFPPNTTVGWFLIGNGWNGSSITNGNYIHYSNTEFNVESDPILQKHNVLLYDEQRELLLLGFEDIRRDVSGCDQDFNDAIFYTSVSPITAIQTSSFQIIDTPNDSDNDGVSDVFDEYPLNPQFAYNNYYPSESSFASLAFEDLWPDKGDYDFNDLVLDYQFNQVLDGLNKVAKLDVKILVKAIGAGYHNGFGIELNINNSLVSSVSGNSLLENYIVTNSNGTESNQTKAVIIVFDNAFNILPHPGVGNYVNTESMSPFVEPGELNISILLNQSVDQIEFGLPPYNPFLIVDQDRSVEVHLPSKAPTNLADLSLFGQGDDNSSVSNSQYYISQNYMPWAMNIPVSFSYPLEKTSISQAYLVFVPWAESGGFSYMDWYINNSGYRNSQLIY